MARQDDLIGWSLEEGILSPDVMLGVSNLTDRPLIKREELNYDSSNSFLTGDNLSDHTYPFYDDYDSQKDGSSSNNSLDSLGLASPSNGTISFTTSNGMATCEKCGQVGVKHAFYSKSKRFCSLACSRSFATSQRAGKVIQRAARNHTTVVLPSRKPKKKSSVKRTKGAELNRSFDWAPYLKDEEFIAAPVDSFKHAPLSDVWDNITVGMKVEVVNKDCDTFNIVFWIATVIKIAGYKVLLRYEGFGSDSSQDFWINVCSQDLHAVGWCATIGKPLVPPQTIQHKYSDWKEFLVRRLTGARTLPSNFYNTVQESIKSKFKFGMKVEVVDKTRISQMQVATVDHVVGGRLHLRYDHMPADIEGFWCHERSPLLHHVGWSQLVGHDIIASPEYKKKSIQKVVFQKYDDSDATRSMFKPEKTPPEGIHFSEGMKLEAIDPLSLSTVCVATVSKVLRNNYIMIEIDGAAVGEKGADWFCYHTTSPCIFPVGFSELNKIDLSPPRGYKGDFKWFDYLKHTGSVAAPVALFKRDIPNHGFKVGMRVEAVDLMEPRLICVGTVKKVVGRLLQIHFDGWESSYDQWCDCESPDMYPLGWCELVGYYLEAPKQTDGFGRNNLIRKRSRKPKNQMYKGPRRKKRTKSLTLNTLCNANSALLKMDTNIGRTQIVKFPISGTPKVNEIVQLNGLKNLPQLIQTTFARSSSIPTATIPNDYKSGLIGAPQLVPGEATSPVNPETWSIGEVVQFLTMNDCGAHCESFSKKGIDGQKLLALTKEQIVSLTGMKVGPSLKIFELIQQLKYKR